MTSALYLSARSQISAQRRDAAVHGKHAVRGDEPRAAVLRILQVLFELGEIAIRVTQAPRFAEPDAVDDAGVIERIRDDGVLFTEHGFEQSAVGIPARRIQDGVFGAEEARQRRFELLVHGLRAADEAHRRHAVAVAVDGAVCCLADRWMTGQPQVVVSAKIYDVGVVGADLSALGAGDHALGLEQALLAQFVELGIETLIERRVHEGTSGKGKLAQLY